MISSYKVFSLMQFSEKLYETKSVLFITSWLAPELFQKNAAEGHRPLLLKLTGRFEGNCPLQD